MAFAIDSADIRQAFGGAYMEKNEGLDEVWGSFNTVTQWAYLIYNDCPNNLRRSRRRSRVVIHGGQSGDQPIQDPSPIEDQSLEPNIVPMSEALLEREIVRLAAILTPGHDDRWSLNSMLHDGRTLVRDDKSQEHVPMSLKTRAYMKIKNLFWYYQRYRDYGRRADTAGYFGWKTWGRSVYEEVEHERAARSSALASKKQRETYKRYTSRVRPSKDDEVEGDGLGSGNG